MKLIAKKPCSFGGRQFYIGDEIPTDLVTDAKQQEQYGMIAIVNTEGVPGGESGTLFTLEQAEKMVAEAVDKVENYTLTEMEELQKYRELGVTPEQVRQIDENYAELAKELAQVKKESANGIVINLRGWDYSETGKATDVTATPEQIQHTFSILQCMAEDGVKYIADITDETVLLLIHAADSRKTVKNAAKEQRDKLSSTKEETNEATGGNATTDIPTEGS
ncbi:MAG: hypothetical protein HFH73_07815 [Lachnospiraceae bacterium]|jgi:hypothetical protein|nr:hypothetical protein [Lachnospiraceae bacterium]